LAPVSSSNSALASLSGSQAMISALKGYAKITNRQTFSAITLNRQPAPLAKTSQLSYLARTTPGTSGTGGSALPGLEPGLLTTGFLSNIVPTVLDNQSVLLQFSIDSSELKSLGVISTGQGATLQSIQTPQVDAVQTVQRVALKSGATLVLTGFEREVLRYDQRGLTEKIGLGGSYSGQSNKESVVIILTPVIVDGA
jgi:type IVB pilus formation R64 PilN family outer membrane protein